MPPEFVTRLRLSDEERRRILSLGASTPLALLAMRKASPAAFEEFFGHERAEQIASALLEMLSDQERKLLEAPSPRLPKLGARLRSPAPPLQEPPYDLVQRNRLFAELQELRRKPSPTAEAQKRITALEEELNQLLKSGQ